MNSWPIMFANTIVLADAGKSGLAFQFRATSGAAVEEKRRSRPMNLVCVHVNPT